MTNFNHGAFDHWYNSDRLAEPRARLVSDLRSRDNAGRQQKNKSTKTERCGVLARLSAGLVCRKAA